MMLSFDITLIESKNFICNKLFGKKKKLFWLTSIKLVSETFISVKKIEK